MSLVSFDKFLANLSSDRDQAGEKYDELRQALIRYFRFKGDASPEDAADTVFDRVFQKLAENSTIHEISNYCFGVARLVALERSRAVLREEQAAERFYQIQNDNHQAAHNGNSDLSDFRFCLEQLSSADRELLAKYFKGATKDERNRQRAEIAAVEKVTLSCLRTRVHRLRQSLIDCLQKRRCAK